MLLIIVFLEFSMVLVYSRFVVNIECMYGLVIYICDDGKLFSECMGYIIFLFIVVREDVIEK